MGNVPPFSWVSLSITNVQDSIEVRRRLYLENKRRQWLEEVTDPRNARFLTFAAWKRQYEEGKKAIEDEPTEEQKAALLEDEKKKAEEEEKKKKEQEAAANQSPGYMQKVMLDMLVASVKNNILTIMTELTSKVLGPAERALDAIDQEVAEFLNDANCIILTYRFQYVDPEKFTYIRQVACGRLAKTLVTAIQRESARLAIESKRLANKVKDELAEQIDNAQQEASAQIKLANSASKQQIALAQSDVSSQIDEADTRVSSEVKRAEDDVKSTLTDAEDTLSTHTESLKRVNTVHNMTSAVAKEAGVDMGAVGSALAEFDPLDPNLQIDDATIERISDDITNKIMAEIKKKEEEAAAFLDSISLNIEGVDVEKLNQSLTQMRQFLRGFIQSQMGTLLLVIRNVIQKMLKMAAKYIGIIQKHAAQHITQQVAAKQLQSAVGEKIEVIDSAALTATKSVEDMTAQAIDTSQQAQAGVSDAAGHARAASEHAASEAKAAAAAAAGQANEAVDKAAADAAAATAAAGAQAKDAMGNEVDAKAAEMEKALQQSLKINLGSGDDPYAEVANEVLMEVDKAFKTLDTFIETYVKQVVYMVSGVKEDPAKVEEAKPAELPASDGEPKAITNGPEGTAASESPAVPNVQA